MALRLARGTIPLVAALLLLAAACSPSGTGPPGGAIATPLPTDATSGLSVRPSASTSPLTSLHLQAVYNIIQQRFVDRVDHLLLLDAADEAMRDALLAEGALPLDTAIPDLAPTGSTSPDRDWLALARSYDALTRKYPDWAAQVGLDHRVLQRMLASLADGHSVFISAEENVRRRETGYSGIGVRLALPAGGQPPRIVEVFPETPAARLGIRAGDRVLAVEGEPIVGIPLSKVVDLIRGPEGSQVSLELQRLGSTTPLHVVLTRKSVDVPMVDWGIAGTLGYVRIRGFTDAVPGMTAAAVADLKSRGARGWVVDLRGNGGGRLSAVQAVAGMFVDARQIGFEVDRSRDRAPLMAQGPRIVDEGPIAVLVDGESASGAEILAAALREMRRATVIGDQTAGNVAVAEEYGLPDGSAVQVTVRRFLGPSGGAINRVGVQPDIPVPTTDADLAAARDPQLARAIQVVQDQLR